MRPKIDGENLQVVQRLLEEQNDALLSELCTRLQEHTGIVVSVPTMYRAVQRLRISYKKNDVCKCSKYPSYSTDALSVSPLVVKCRPT